MEVFVPIAMTIGVGLIVLGLAGLVFDFEPFNLWLTFVIAGALLFAPTAAIADATAERERSPDYGYNYCPNCGYELQKGK